ncbi:MAG: RluA family pseudouridine synthase [Erysipelotrichaceae bacterium]|nr:RluA family pseudouridine synthase [Erysipelotrichaceae bacterium]
MANYKEIIVSSDSKQRLDVYLLPFFSYSRSHLLKKIKQHEITVNGSITLASYLPKKGDKIVVFLDESGALTPSNKTVQIVFQDDDLAVINKPKGMVVHPSIAHHDDTLVHALIEKVSLSDHDYRPGIVHRLDKDTSGLLLIAKNNFTHHELAKQLKHHMVHREYLLLIKGQLQQKHFIVEGSIGRDPKNFKKMMVTPLGKPAKTEFFFVKQYQNYSLYRAKLYTGRTHQIRVHLAKLGHPIVGDALYGGDLSLTNKGQLLAAVKLAFVHPTTKKKMAFEIEVDVEFKRILQRLSAL